MKILVALIIRCAPVMVGVDRRVAHRSLLYLFTTTIHTGVLGAMLTFAPRPFYRTLDPGLFDATGLTPLEDQQLGGFIMWVPGALVCVSVALVLAARWLRALDTSSEAARPM